MRGAVFSLLFSGLHLMSGELRSISWKGRGEVRTFPGAGMREGQFYLGAGAGLVAGSDQVGGVGQVDEELLLRLQSRSR